MIGDGARILVARALAHGSLDPAVPEALLEEVSALFLLRYAARPVVDTALLPGAREALALGLPAAVVTNKPRAITLLVLEELGIAGSFGVVVAGGDAPLKPSPRGVEAALAALGVPAASAWMIGDGPQDVLAGRAAGCFTIAVPGIAARERVLAAAPHLVVASLDDVARLARASVTSA